MTERSQRPHVVLPDPGRAGTLDELTGALRSLKVWAGDPSYGTIKNRINAGWQLAGRPDGELTGRTTVADCFRPGRRRLNAELVLAVVRALHPDPGYLTQWRQALQMVAGETRAAAQVRVQDVLPEDIHGFTGRAAAVDRLRQACGPDGVDVGSSVICSIVGMAGTGKTRLAVRTAHLLARQRPFDRVLFVNLRGFHPDPAQPPADPAAVLDGFLRLLGVSGQRIPHDLAARTAAFRSRLAGTRTLVLLDNAADADQVRPLLAATPGCPVLITSRRGLGALDPTIQVTVEAFTPGEAMEFLAGAAPGVPVGDDPDAMARISRRCGLLPLALGLIAGHLRASSGWTLTDHADRLDERHRDRRLDTGVELAFDVSRQRLPAAAQRQLRLAALHPGPDFDIRAAAALSGTDLPTAGVQLDRLCSDHLLQRSADGRYTFHDLVRAYAAGRAGDEDPPPDRRAALTRLFDVYLATAAEAMDGLYPAEADRRPRVPPTGTDLVPALDQPGAARAWLDTERSTLVAVAAHAAVHGWPTHAVRLSSTLFRYLAGGYLADALAVHGHARDAARRCGDLTGQAHALTSLGVTHLQRNRFEAAAECLEQALQVFRQTGDQAGEARALTNLGVVDERLGRHRPAADHFSQAITLFRRTGHRGGEAHALTNLGDTEGRLGGAAQGIEHVRQALALFRQLGDRTGEAWTLNTLGDVELRLGRYGPASDHLGQALVLYRQLGHRVGEAWTLNGLGRLHTRLGQTSGRHQEALAIFRETGERSGEASALNGLGEAAHGAGAFADALARHDEARAIAVDVDHHGELARAHAGLGHARQALAAPDAARQHYRHALALYTDLGMPEADEVRTRLGAVDDGRMAVADTHQAR